MKKKHIFMAIALGTAIGLYIGVNVDLNKSHLSKVVDEIRKCVKQGFETEEAWHYHDHEREKGTYQVKDFLNPSKEGTVICKNDICLPPSKREG
jgi:hypothetical protein